MPFLKGVEVGGYTDITRDVRFSGATTFGKDMWGNKVWYCDYANGSSDKDGSSPSQACSNLQTLLTKAGNWDTIYVRPDNPDVGSGEGDPGAIVAGTANWTLSSGKEGVAIIGTGRGHGRSAPYQTRLQGSASVLATPVLYIKSPFVTLENLSFKRGGSTDSGVTLYSGENYPQVFGATVYNCLFWKIGATATNGALNINSSWHCDVIKSYFMECARGIVIDAAQSEVVGTTIQGCQFLGGTATIDADIQAPGTPLETVIDSCIFGHEIPSLSAGTIKLYINLEGSGCTGSISNNVFHTATGTITSCVDGGNALLVNNWYVTSTNLVDGT
jgi:hypothetical protein